MASGVQDIHLQCACVTKNPLQRGQSPVGGCRADTPVFSILSRLFHPPNFEFFGGPRVNFREQLSVEESLQVGDIDSV
jgi:hypothetical protein